ncbi:MAG: germination protein YpeB [Bacillota bacterium]|nr:germination protein YpeB [Bacillota bacterium]
MERVDNPDGDRTAPEVEATGRTQEARDGSGAEAAPGRGPARRPPFRRQGPAWLNAVLGLGLVAALAWGGWEHSARQRMQMALEARYQQAFYDTVDRSGQAEVALDKALVASSPTRRAYQLQEVWRYASQAHASLSLLPLSSVDLSPTRKFLAQLGDYAHVLADRLSAGTAAGSAPAPAREQTTQLLALRQALSQLNGQLHATARNLSARNYLWSSALEPRPVLALHLPRLGRSGGGPAPQGQAAPAATLARAPGVPAVDPLFAQIARANREIERMPSLAYDGPFSDEALSMTPKAPGGPNVSAAAARRTALAWAEASRGPGGGPSWRVSASPQQLNGPLPAYRFVLTRDRAGGTEQLIVDVWRAGGHVLSLLSNRGPGRARLGPADARRIASDFVRRLGFAGAVPTYSLVTGSIATVTLVDTTPSPGAGGAAGGAPGAAAGGEPVLLYPDLLKVRVALDDGEVVGFDGLPYWLHHRSRALPAPRISASQAAAIATGTGTQRGLPPASRLTVEAVRPAVIPLESGREAFTWEVRARSSSSVYLIYVDVADGSEERILLMVPTPGGQLTM